MLKLFAAVAVVVALAASLHALRSGAPPALTPAPATLHPGGLTIVHLPSGGRDAPERDALVYAPPDVDPSTLPVLYFLHGLPGQPQELFDAGFGTFLDAYWAKGGKRFLVVAPDGNGVAHHDTEWADAADGQDRLETFVTHILIPAIEGTHNRPRARRAIAGFSMGGYGAMNLALRHPLVFGEVVSIAGYFHIDDPDGVFTVRGSGLSNDPFAHVPAARHTKILLMDGDHDDDPVVSGDTKKFKKALDAAHIPATLVVSKGGHDWDYVATTFGPMTDFLARAWS